MVQRAEGVEAEHDGRASIKAKDQLILTGYQMYNYGSKQLITDDNWGGTFGLASHQSSTITYLHNRIESWGLERWMGMPMIVLGEPEEQMSLIYINHCSLVALHLFLLFSLGEMHFVIAFSCTRKVPRMLENFSARFRRLATLPLNRFNIYACSWTTFMYSSEYYPFSLVLKVVSWMKRPLRSP